MPKIKILYIITKADIGGAQKYVTDLAENLDKNQFKAKILYGGRNLNPHTKKALAALSRNNDAFSGVEVKWLSNKIWPWAFFLNDWLAVLELIKIYKKEQPNIMHLNSSKAGILGALAAKLYNATCHMSHVPCHMSHVPCRMSHVACPKVIFTAHGWVFNPTNKLSFLNRWFYILLHKLAARFQDKIICVSEYDRRLALKYKIAPKEKLVIIHNGINPDIRFLDKERARAEILKKIQNADMQIECGYADRGNKINKKSASSAYHQHHPHYNWPWIGSIGRLVKEKNYETFIQAAALVPKAIFFIIGSGPEYENYKLQITNYKLQNRFFLINPAGEDYKYLKAFDVFVMSSIKEGCPYILLEAMSAELPIVVTNAGGMPEMIKDGQNGLVVPQKNPEMLAKAARKLLENKNVADELGKAAKKTVQEKFGLGRMILRTEAIYKENL